MATPPFWFKFEESGQYAIDSISGLRARMYDSTPGDRGVSFASYGLTGNGLLGDGQNEGYASDPAWEYDGALVEHTESVCPTVFSLGCRFKTTVKQNKVLVCFNKDGATQPHVSNMALEFKTSSYGYSAVGFHFWYVLGGGTSLNTTLTTEMNYDNGESHSVLVTFNGSEGYMYVDDCTIPIGPIYDVPFADPGVYRWRIGGGADGSEIVDGVFDGMIDDVRYWDYAVTPTEICEYFNPPPVGVVNAIMFSCNT